MGGGVHVCVSEWVCEELFASRQVCVVALPSLCPFDVYASFMSLHRRYLHVCLFSLFSLQARVSSFVVGVSDAQDSSTASVRVKDRWAAG
mmetsp:Transcript_19248/g.46462  ORF Transcript_19248/g.46462 Transcript_19248/m.46462 type:complete len:90 (-) Transcript_19248:141-410(-)